MLFQEEAEVSKSKYPPPLCQVSKVASALRSGGGHEGFSCSWHFNSECPLYRCLLGGSGQERGSEKASNSLVICVAYHGSYTPFTSLRRTYMGTAANVGYKTIILSIVQEHQGHKDTVLYMIKYS